LLLAVESSSLWVKVNGENTLFSEVRKFLVGLENFFSFFLLTEPGRVEESTLWGSALSNDTYKLSERSGGHVTIWPDGEIYAVRWDSPNYS